MIAAHVHGVPRGELHVVPDTAFDPRYWDEVARRAAREPLQHITGHAYFRYLDLEVGPGVFVPRPETEVMTGWAIDWLPRDGRRRAASSPTSAPVPAPSRWPSPRKCPESRVHAVEADPLARQWAARNIARLRRHGAAHRGPGHAAGEDFAVPWVSWTAPLDLVISNPPYIPAGAWVPPEVGEYDPATALWGGPTAWTRSGSDRAGSPAAAPPRRPGRGGARRTPGSRRVLGFRRGERLARHAQP